MGEDIHISTYVKSKVENKYINAMNLTTCPQYFEFKPFFEGRYYDLFALFGSQRSDMKPLEGANYGIPDFVNPTYRKHLEDMHYYGFIWFNIVDLKNSIEKYLHELTDVMLYFDGDDDVAEQAEKGFFDVDAWRQTYADPMTKTLTRIL